MSEPVVRIGGEAPEDVDMGGDSNEVDEAIEALEGADGGDGADETLAENAIAKPTFVE